MDRVVLIIALLVPLALAGLVLPAVGGLRLPFSGGGEGARAPATAVPRLVAVATPEATRRGFSLEPNAPPTLVPFDFVAPTAVPTPGPAGAASPAPAAPRATAVERVVIFNTGGIGAAVREAPGSARQVAGMREGDQAEVLERRTVGNGEWIRVRTAAGAEGWITGLVARRVDPAPGVAAGTPGPLGAAGAPGAVGTAGRPAAPTPAAVAGTAPARATSATTASGRVHVVQRGDELRHIAAANGVSMAAILAINDIPNADSLTVGQALTIPDP